MNGAIATSIHPPSYPPAGCGASEKKHRMKLKAASPAPTCASDASDHSMDRPVVFKRVKLKAASPAPTCASDASDHSMDRPVVFKQRVQLEAAPPAPTCASDASDCSMDRPVVFKMSLQHTSCSEYISRMKLKAASPAPTCASDASDHSMDRPVVFKKRMKIEAASPTPTCASDASDCSMDRPVVFKMSSQHTSYSDYISRAILLAASPAPTCASEASDHSMDRPVVFKHGVKLKAASPAPTCASDASDHSMDRTVVFKRVKLEAASPAPTCASDASDHSMDRPVVFKHGMKLEAASPAPTCASDASDHSMDRPVVFKRPSSPTCITLSRTLLFSKSEEDIGELSACLLTEDHFRCPVCSDVLKEPVSIPCGHSYCKTCIQTYWNKPAHEGSYSCLQCRKRFKTRPALNPNSALAKLVQKLQLAGISPALPAHCYAGPGDVSCDFCTGRKLRAVKSCLTCSASYCETHVKQHYTVAALQRHTLVEATGDLEQRLCKLHQRALEVFCKTDQTLICFICLMEEHKGHETALSKSEDSMLKIPVHQQIEDPVQVPVYKTEQLEDGKSHIISYNSLSKSKMEQQLMQLLKELTARTEKAESELAECFSRGPEQAKDFVEVAALGRPLDLGMLYDCHNDSFSSGVFLWDVDTLSSMKLSLPRPHTDVRILEGKSLQDRLRALDLTTAVRASVVSGLVEVSGAAAFLKHHTHSHMQDRVTVRYRTSTRLDMLSHRLLHSGTPLLTNQNSATHVVVAVLYGAQAYFLLDEKNERSKGSGKLKDDIKRNVESQSVDELLLNLEQADCFCKCDLYADGEDFKHPGGFKTAVNQFRSLHELLEPDSERAVPLKVWLYPLNNLKPASANVVGTISEDLLNNAVDVLEKLEENISISQDLMFIYSSLEVPTWYPGLKEAHFEFSALLQKYQSVFQKGLGSCIMAVRERGEEGEKNLRDLLKRNAQSPFSPQNMSHWLLNKDAKVMGLNVCRSANINILKSQEDLQQVIENSQADRVLCFTLSSLEAEDPFLSALKQHMDLPTTLNTQEVQPPFRLPDISQNILNNLHSFLSSRETNEDEEHTELLAALVPQPGFPGNNVCLFQFGKIVNCNVKLDLKPQKPEILKINPTFVSLRLHRSEYSVDQWYRVEYRAVTCRGNSAVCLKWNDIDIDICSTEESSIIKGLKPETQYQLRYAVMDSNSMSDYSRITEFQTHSRARPGQPTILNQNSDSLTVSWQSPEADGVSSVLCYMVEFMEAGLEGWQFVLTEGPDCKYTITHPYSTCYRVRVSAVYGEGDTSEPSEEKEVTLKTWIIDLSKRKSSLFLEVLKLQTGKKPVKLRGFLEKESEVRSFLQCLPYISQLSFRSADKKSDEWKKRVHSFLLDLCLQAALQQKEDLYASVKKLISCSYDEKSDFLLDLFSHVKKYETETGSSVIPAFLPVYQSVPAVWSIILSERKSSLLLEVLKLQTVKKPVELRGWSDEDGEVRSFLQCLPFISQLRFINCQQQNSVIQFLLKLITAAQGCNSATENFTTLLTSVCSYATFPFHTEKKSKSSVQSDFLLDLFSHVKKYETETGRSVLPALQPVYQSAPAVWSINLSERKSSLLLEVLKLQTEKKPVELRGWSDEESEVRSFLQCLPFISQLRFVSGAPETDREFMLKLTYAALECDSTTGKNFTEMLLSVCENRKSPSVEKHEIYSILSDWSDLHTEFEHTVDSSALDYSSIFQDITDPALDYSSIFQDITDPVVKTCMSGVLERNNEGCVYVGPDFCCNAHFSKKYTSLKSRP